MAAQGPPVSRPGSGIDYKKLWEEVKENSRKLDACPGPHDFIDLTPGRLGGRARCSKCEGEIRKADLYWYNQGLKHGRQSR